jgi:hypothetical protein
MVNFATRIRGAFPRFENARERLAAGTVLAAKFPNKHTLYIRRKKP